MSALVAVAARPTPRRPAVPVLVAALAGAAGLTLVLGLPADAEVARVVLWELRVPRLLLALLGGAAVGAAGLLMQTALRNPLASPELLGVSTGGALAAAAVVVWALPVPAAVQPLVALAGALCGGAICLAAAGAGRGPGAVLLIGAAVSTALQAVLLAVLAAADRLQYDTLFRYLVGSLSGVTWAHAQLTLPWLLACVPLTVLASPALGVLRLGDEAAAALGLRVGRARLVALGLAAVLVAAVVGPCGPIAWIGFVAPHAARRLRPTADARLLLPWAAAFGALFTTVADLAARHVFAPAETPLGAWTAAVGIVAGLVMLARRGRS
ncbi:iron complex transport system permease protein [Micromonospora citrea]|uniref:Iron complex transport system permease protein n=1 Tax=Micromonospora citrea TaxID=47855 RepID=A0A1C6VY48_9ACTN|nr:iron ABC transporter permease [Micromonospora citrea]SCL71248.1 iron complex transport system permease protein [Micromonospora citrea]